MKKILIVNNNMKVGGVQKSLYNLLWTIAEEYDITLALFRKTGAYAEMLPPSVKVVEIDGPFGYLGASQREYRGIEFIKRGGLAALSRIFGRQRVLSILKCHQTELDQTFDCAISYLHNGRVNSFYGGVQDFVLNHIKAKKKIAFLHGDYQNCGSNNHLNNCQLEQFDVIAACSDGCRRAFLEVLPHLADKSVTVRNCHLFDEITQMSVQDSILYNGENFNVLMVARLSYEKGIDRAIRAVSYANSMGANVHLHIVGGGLERERLQSLTQELDVTNSVVFYGEQKNPYRYMKHADLLMISSYHEAAPMVIDEARCLGVPILTTETTSSHDMVLDVPCGWVCENCQSAINDTLYRIASDRSVVTAMKEKIQQSCVNNAIAISEWRQTVDV